MKTYFRKNPSGIFYLLIKDAEFLDVTILCDFLLRTRWIYFIQAFPNHLSNLCGAAYGHAQSYLNRYVNFWIFMTFYKLPFNFSWNVKTVHLGFGWIRYQSASVKHAYLKCYVSSYKLITIIILEKNLKIATKKSFPQQFMSCHDKLYCDEWIPWHRVANNSQSFSISRAN